MQKIVFYKVYKATRPYITSRRIPETVAQDLGFAFREKKNCDDQWFRIAPKSEQQWEILKNKLKKKYKILAKLVEPDANKTEELGWDVFNGYEWGLMPNKEGEKLSNKLIRSKSRHRHLIGCKIAHFFKSSPAPYDETTGRMEFAYATIANKMNEKFAGFDFILYYYEDAWMSCTRDQRIMLCDHELGHCGIEGVPYLKDHDIQEFSFMVDEYGLKPPSYHWAPDAVKRCLQARESV